MNRRQTGFASVVFLVLVLMVVVRTGAPGLMAAAEPKVHDAASVAALPYTLSGEDGRWLAEYRVSEADEALREQGAYQAVLTLCYLGGEDGLAGVRACTVTFDAGGEHEMQVKLAQGGSRSVAECLTGRTPCWTAVFPEDASVAGGIPPVDGAYTLKIDAAGAGGVSDTLTLRLEEGDA